MNTSNRLEIINRIAKKTHHVDGQEWLNNSSLSMEDLKLLESKFQDQNTLLFRLIESLTPEEALAIPLKVASSIASSGYAPIEELLNFNQCRLVGQILFADKQRYGVSHRENIGADIVIVQNYGTKTEIKHAQSMYTRKLSHPSYPKACDKLKEMSKKYTELNNQNTHPLKSEWYNYLPLFRATNSPQLMVNDIVKSGVVSDVNAPDIHCFSGIFEAREACHKANNAANYHKFHVAKTETGFAVRQIAQYLFDNTLVLMNEQMTWSVIVEQKHYEFGSIQEAFQSILSNSEQSGQ